ncbi:MAG: cell division protein FtsQ/DivIB [Patescibacteria group bacterium]|nr:cell division protein FtsQ/DivIB [Patescibacteria group bacterium]
MLPSMGRTIKSGRKFDYSKRNYSNPFFHRRKRKKIKPLELPWRIKLIIIEVIILIIGLIWFFCFSAYFTIEMINVIGAEKISSQEIKNLTWQQIEHRRFLFGSQKNLILFNKSKLFKIINEQYCVDSLFIERKLPNIITIKFKEKIHSAVWRENDKYYYIDEAGNIITEANPLEIKQKNYPLIDCQRKKAVINNKKIIDQEENIDCVIQLFNKLNNKHEFEIECFIIDNEVNTVKVAIIQGPQIYFNTNEDLEKQIAKLLTLINEKLKDDFNKKNYIDLRYGDRVYYR